MRPLVDGGDLDLDVGVEGLVDGLAGLDVLQLGAHEGAALARLVVLEPDDRPELAVEVENHAVLEVVGRCHARVSAFVRSSVGVRPAPYGAGQQPPSLSPVRAGPTRQATCPDALRRTTTRPGPDRQVLAGPDRAPASSARAAAAARRTTRLRLPGPAPDLARGSRRRRAACPVAAAYCSAFAVASATAASRACVDHRVAGRRPGAGCRRPGRRCRRRSTAARDRPAALAQVRDVHPGPLGDAVAGQRRRAVLRGSRRPGTSTARWSARRASLTPYCSSSASTRFMVALASSSASSRSGALGGRPRARTTAGQGPRWPRPVPVIVSVRWLRLRRR